MSVSIWEGSKAQALVDAITDANNQKVDKQQGTINAGKALLIGNDGIVAPGDAGLPDAAKRALLTCFRKVTWIDGNGQTYYDNLEAALYGGTPDTPVISSWDYEWNAASGIAPIGKDNVPYPGSFSNNLFVMANPASGTDAYIFPIANNGAIEAEIEFQVVSMIDTDWWPLINFGLSSANGLFIGRVGDNGVMRSNISGSNQRMSETFPQKEVLHKLHVIVKSNDCKFSFDNGTEYTGPGGPSMTGLTDTGFYLVPSTADKMGLKSIKFKYL